MYYLKQLNTWECQFEIPILVIINSLGTELNHQKRILGQLLDQLKFLKAVTHK